MDKKELMQAAWPRVVGFAGMGLVLATLTVETIYADRTAVTFTGLGMAFIGISNSAGMRSVLEHTSLNGRFYEVTGSRFSWTPLATLFGAVSAAFFIAAAIRLFLIR